MGTSSSPAKGYTAAAVAPVDPNYATYQKADMAVEVISMISGFQHSAG